MRRPKPKVRRPTKNSLVLFKGDTIKGHAVRLVVSGVKKPSDNPKTGPVPQVSMYVDNGESPLDNQKSGADEAICNGCALRPFVASTCPECRHEHPVMPATRKCEKCRAEMPRCYVRTMFGERSKEKSTRDDQPISLEEAAVALDGQWGRWGTYGNTSNVAQEYAEPLLQLTAPWNLLYEEEWTEAHAQWLKHYAMASVGISKEAATEAKGLGWRHYRVLIGEDRLAVKEGRFSDVDLMPNEVLCPYYTHGRQCVDCGLCNGVGEGGKRSRVKSVASPAI